MYQSDPPKMFDGSLVNMFKSLKSPLQGWTLLLRNSTGQFKIIKHFSVFD